VHSVHRPEQLANEIASAGLVLTEVVGVEGLASAARLVETEPTLLGLSGHLPAVARRAND